MRVRVMLHGWYRLGVEGSDKPLELDVPDGTDVAGVAQVLRRQSPMLDAYASLIIIEGSKVEVDRVLADAEEVHFYPIFSGG
jgi:hypothetical protein